MSEKRAKEQRANAEVDMLGVERSLTLQQREWTVIFNILVDREYKLGDAVIVMSIINKLQPLVAVASNIVPPITKEQKDVIITKKDNLN